MNTRQAKKIIKNSESGAINYPTHMIAAARAHLVKKPHIEVAPAPVVTAPVVTAPAVDEHIAEREEFDFTDADYGRKSTIPWMKLQLGNEFWESDWRKRDFIIAMIARELQPHAGDLK